MRSKVLRYYIRLESYTIFSPNVTLSHSLSNWNSTIIQFHIKALQTCCHVVCVRAWKDYANIKNDKVGSRSKYVVHMLSILRIPDIIHIFTDPRETTPTLSVGTWKEKTWATPCPLRGAATVRVTAGRVTTRERSTVSMSLSPWSASSLSSQARVERAFEHTREHREPDSASPATRQRPRNRGGGSSLSPHQSKDTWHNEKRSKASGGRGE
jgi:hypothetical protein